VQHWKIVSKALTNQSILGALDKLAAPATDFLQTLAACVFKKPHAMAGVFKLVDVRPDFRLPRLVVGGGLAASGAPSVQADGRHRRSDDCSRQFDEDAANFPDLFVFIEHVFVTQQVTESQFAGFGFGFLASVKRAIFRPQLLGGVASHPEGFYVVHSRPTRDCRIGSNLLAQPALWSGLPLQFAGRLQWRRSRCFFSLLPKLSNQP
jgi:hypothetical protein